LSTKNTKKLEIDVSECSIYLLSLLDKHIFRIGQMVPCKYKGRQLKFTVESFVGGARTSSASLGMFTRSTAITLKLGLDAGECGISLKGGLGKKLEFKGNFDFESMGIGGLDTQFTSMFRKAFASRMFPGVVAKMGLNHVRGMLLYGPPGCGKTLIARQIARILDVDDGNIKIVNGPEVLSKMIGESEENVRKQFADAEAEQKAKGDDSSLHIIIFDEMDSIMKIRGAFSHLLFILITPLLFILITPLLVMIMVRTVIIATPNLPFSFASFYSYTPHLPSPSLSRTIPYCHQYLHPLNPPFPIL
jgi:vesicle-fusing ATPase